MRKSPITEVELARYLKALRRAGFDSGRVEIKAPDGTEITVVAVAGETSEPAPGNDFDTLIERVKQDAPTS